MQWARIGLMILVAVMGMNGGQAAPLKVFILAGQSNMEGHAKVTTFDYIGDDPVTAPLLKQMRNPDGTPLVCDRVWISYLTGDNTEKLGKLTVGYGALGSEPKIGPEFTFGIRLQESVRGPILLIKTAWGGKNLHTDFRSPSAGPFELPPRTREIWDQHPQGAHGIPKLEDREAWWQDVRSRTGVYYRRMIEHVKKVLADPGRVCPAYDPQTGYEIAGFVWLQGWNDLCDGTPYPHVEKGKRYALYSDLLAHFIRDVRKDLGAPQMPFVIGVMGVGGETTDKNMLDFRQAMTAPARLPEFKGRVVAVPTAPFWDARLGAIDAKRARVNQRRWELGNQVKAGKLTKEEADRQVREFEETLITEEDRQLWARGASNGGYHYLGCAKTFALMGRAFADAWLNLEKP